MINLIFNKIYPKVFYFIYKRCFLSIKYGSKIFFPRLAMSKKVVCMGKNSTILQNSRIEAFANSINKNPKLYIGNNVSIQYYFTALIGDDIIIHDDVLLASNVKLISENHSTDPTINGSYCKQGLEVAKIEIDEGAWIGEGSCILPGVHIGKKSIVGAMSVVTKDVPDYSKVVGNPARIIKKFDFSSKKWEKINSNV